MKENILAPKQLLNCNFTLPSAKLDMVISRLVSNGLVFSDNTPVDILVVTFILLCNTTELSTGAKTRKLR